MARSKKIKNDVDLIRQGLYLAFKSRDFNILTEVQRLLQYGDVSDRDKLTALVSMFKYIFPTLRTQEVTITNTNEVKIAEDREAAQNFVDMVGDTFLSDLVKNN